MFTVCYEIPPRPWYLESFTKVVPLKLGSLPRGALVYPLSLRCTCLGARNTKFQYLEPVPDQRTPGQTCE